MKILLCTLSPVIFSLPLHCMDSTKRIVIKQNTIPLQKSSLKSRSSTPVERWENPFPQKPTHFSLQANLLSLFKIKTKLPLKKALKKPANHRLFLTAFGRLLHQALDAEVPMGRLNTETMSIIELIPEKFYLRACILNAYVQILSSREITSEIVIENNSDIEIEKEWITADSIPESYSFN
jgi:hypothetical protein